MNKYGHGFGQLVIWLSILLSGAEFGGKYLPTTWLTSYSTILIDVKSAHHFSDLKCLVLGFGSSSLDVKYLDSSWVNSLDSSQQQWTLLCRNFNITTAHSSVYFETITLFNTEQQLRTCGFLTVSPNFYHRKTKKTRARCLYYSNSTASRQLLLMGGDIAVNPGPVTSTSNSRNIPVVITSRPDKHQHSTRAVSLNSRSIINIPTIKEQCPIVKKHLRICCLNARSIKNKTADFVCYAASTGADIFTCTETWLTERDMTKRAEITLPGFKLFDQPRLGRTGGGLALLMKNEIDARKIDGGERRSFEFFEWILRYGSNSLRIVTIYRKPYSQAHPVTTSVFFDEFTTYLESIIMSTEPLLITGDFNIHVDTPDDADASRFIELLSSMGLEQHVDKSTHLSGHTLDLMITRCSDSLLTAKPMTDYLFSDHITVVCDLMLGKPYPKVEQVSFRKLKSVNIENFKQELSTSELCNNSPDSLNNLVECYKLAKQSC